MPFNIDPRQVKKLMRGALANPFDNQDLSGELDTTTETVGTSGLSSSEREVIAAIQDGITDPETIALNTRLTLAEVKKIAEDLKKKGRMAEEKDATQISQSSLASITNSSPSTNPTSSALRNNSGISAKSSIFVPQAGSSKLKLF